MGQFAFVADFGSSSHHPKVVPLAEGIAPHTWQAGYFHQGQADPRDNALATVGVLADACLTDLSRLRSALPESRYPRDDADPVSWILAAYQTLGDRCLEYFDGDFAFVAWDLRLGTVFAARDHFGIRPLYYVQHGSRLWVTSSLGWLLEHGPPPGAPDDQAIGDLLLFGSNQSFSHTFYSNIRRLPPAHHMQVSARGLSSRRYWSLPCEHATHAGNPADLAAGLRNVLTQAVADRLTHGTVGISLSGGMDSSSVAWSLANLRNRRPGLRLVAFTDAHVHQIADPEKRLARMVARALVIPLTIRNLDGISPGVDWSRQPWPVEPGDDAPIQAPAEEDSNCTAMFTGFGGDLILASEPVGFWRRIQLMGWSGVYDSVSGIENRAADFWMRMHGGGARTLPEWLDAGFVRRMALRHRLMDWEQLIDEPENDHHVHVQGHRQIRAPDWPGLFESFSEERESREMEFFHPFHDRRVVEYLLGLPREGYCYRKYLLRYAMRGRLPNAILRRPKQGAAFDSSVDCYAQLLPAWCAQLMRGDSIRRYVNVKRFHERVHQGGRLACREQSMLLAVLSLAHWLRRFD